MVTESAAPRASSATGGAVPPDQRCQLAALFGSSPKLMPPLLRPLALKPNASASSTTTRLPLRASSSAVDRPAKPPPITATSHRPGRVSIIAAKRRVLVPPDRLALEIMIRQPSIALHYGVTPRPWRVQSCFAAITSTSRRSVGMRKLGDAQQRHRRPRAAQIRRARLGIGRLIRHVDQIADDLDDVAHVHVGLPQQDGDVLEDAHGLGFDAGLHGAVLAYADEPAGEKVARPRLDLDRVAPRSGRRPQQR